MATTKLRNRGANFGLFEYAYDLAVGKTRFLQENLLELDYEKIPLLAATDLGGDYQMLEAEEKGRAHAKSGLKPKP